MRKPSSNLKKLKRSDLEQMFLKLKRQYDLINFENKKLKEMLEDLRSELNFYKELSRGVEEFFNLKNYIN
jgi:hypothetical protein